MTEDEWQFGFNVRPMVTFLRDKPSERKLRLFLVACCERADDHISDSRSRSALACARRAADGLVERGELDHEHDLARAAWGAVLLAAGNRLFGAEEFRRMTRMMRTGPGLETQVTMSDPATLAADLVQEASNPSINWESADWAARAVTRLTTMPAEDDATIHRAARTVCDLFRDIFDNPFRPATFDPAWRTEHTTGIALKMYDERQFAAMPILADALEEAGCDNQDILAHCREPGVHVRGCWVVDLVLGKA